MVLLPRDSGTPPAVSFTETARLTALEDTLLLRESATTLAQSAAPEAERPALGSAVTLLTTHAQALLDPHGATSSAASSATSSATPSGGSATVATAASSRGAFVTELAGSGWTRLADARTADGGIARLLAAVGSAQVLQAEKLAAEWQLPLPDQTTVLETKAPSATPLAASCPSASPTPEPTSATTDTALAAVVRSQQEAIYVYQVALKRLDETKSAAAAKHLHVHEVLLRQAESVTSANCADAPTSEAGYRVPEQLTHDPATFLGSLELASLPRFGDLVALSTDETRIWALEGLLSAARRSTAWGAPLPPLPGLTLDAGELPSLPTPTTTPTAKPAATTASKGG